jgi:plasmid stabilization system protein ParE
VRVEILDVAQDEASDAAAYYEREVPGLGYDYLAELDRATIAIGEQPETWPRFGVVRQQTVRRFLLSRFPYSVVYVLRDDHALVVAVAHASRRPTYWARRIPPLH